MMFSVQRTQSLIKDFLAFMGSCDGREYLDMMTATKRAEILTNEVIKLRYENARLTDLLNSEINTEQQS